MPRWLDNTAQGSVSFAAGSHAKALHAGAFVSGDASVGADVASTGAYQFIARASGGVTFYSNSSLTTGVKMAAGGSTWTDLAGSSIGGDITAVNAAAGSGLTGGAASGDVSLAANFTAVGGDSGTATSVARGDHLHDARYAQLAAANSFTGSQSISVAVSAGNALLATNTWPSGSTIGVQGRSDSTSGTGVAAPSNILTVVQNSATDPIADAWTTYSSRRWKTNIQTLGGALGKVERLRGVSFDWKADGRRDIGLIAEEVGEVVPEVVAYEDHSDNGDAKVAMSVDYARLTALLVEAVKEQQAQIRALRAEIAGLKAKLAPAHQPGDNTAK